MKRPENVNLLAKVGKKESLHGKKFLFYETIFVDIMPELFLLFDVVAHD